MKTSVMILMAAGTLSWYCCDLVDESSPPGDEYPTTILPLSPARLDSLKKEFNELNENRICTTLDEFGFPEYSLTPCLSAPVLRIPITGRADVAASKAKLTLIKNARFTNILDTADVTVRRALSISGCIKCDGSPGDIQQIKWRIDFENQRYHGLEVLESGIVVFSDAMGVTMLGGGQFRGIAVPPADKISFDGARALLIGRELHFSDWTGPKTYKVNADSFPPDSLQEKVILQVRTPGKIELRVAWKVPVGIPTPWWNIFVDSTTGDVLREDMLIIF